jgi:hypothetical protein
LGYTGSDIDDGDAIDDIIGRDWLLCAEQGWYRD